MIDRRTCAVKQGGMTLVEVVIAMAILGLAITGITVATGRCLAVAQRARAYSVARALIDRVEQENPLVLMEEVVEGEESGIFEGGPDNFEWERIIERVETAEHQLEEYGMFRVTTRVIWTEGGRESSEEVVSLLFRLDQERNQ